MSKLTLSVRVGNVTTQYDAKSEAAARTVANFALGMIIDDASRATKIQMSRVAKKLPDAIEQSYTQAVMYAATKMIGTKSPLVVKTTSAPVEVTSSDGNELAYWPILSTRTIREQNEIRGSKGPATFFNRTGSLRKELIAMARNYVKRAGQVKIIYKEKLRNSKGQFASASDVRKNVELGDFTIRLLPNISRSDLPGIRSGVITDHNPNLNFERKLGFSSSALQKLKGAHKGSFLIPGTHRPLMQPVFTYWTLNRIPRVIASTINASMPRRTSISQAGNDVFEMGS